MRGLMLAAVGMASQAGAAVLNPDPSSGSIVTYTFSTGEMILDPNYDLPYPMPPTENITAQVSFNWRLANYHSWEIDPSNDPDLFMLYGSGRGQNATGPAESKAFFSTGGYIDSYPIEFTLGLRPDLTLAFWEIESFGGVIRMSDSADSIWIVGIPQTGYSVFTTYFGPPGTYTVELSPVPIPASALLLLAGIGGLAAHAVRRRP